MVFNSLGYLLLFLPSAVVLHRLAAAWDGVRGAKAALLAASLVFYLAAGPQMTFVLLGSFLLNHLVAARLVAPAEGRSRKPWLLFGLVTNVSLLAGFKYTGFILENVSALTGWHPLLPSFVLPLGLSFFTIQQIMYLVDCYEGQLAPAGVLEHALFISFFPCISAGPILRGGGFLPQLDAPDRLRAQRMDAGLVLLAIGLVKKVIVSEQFAHFAEQGFRQAGSLNAVEAWVTVPSFSFQVYYDFSGYTDIAVGTGLLFGLEVPRNFNSPYLATTMIEFWNRWHMTLSEFINAYLYTPMARAVWPFTFRKAMLITVVVMTIAGLWHGAAWTYVIFGLIHGIGIVINHNWRKRKRKLPAWLARTLVFLYASLAFVFFRSASVPEAWSMLKSLAGAHGLAGNWTFPTLSGPHTVARRVVTLAAAFLCVGLPNSDTIAAQFKPRRLWAVACATAVVVCLVFVNVGEIKEFLYRDF